MTDTTTVTFKKPKQITMSVGVFMFIVSVLISGTVVLTLIAINDVYDVTKKVEFNNNDKGEK